MNKFGIVLGAAAVATLAGCKDPDYKYANASPAQTEVKSVETTTVTPIEPSAAPSCKCAPGTKHAVPCKCGAPDCACIVETKPIPVEPLPPAAPVAAVPAAPATTVYIVQEGDYLAKISKKYNVTMNSIRRLNPSIKKDVIRVGQKIKLPGTVDVGVQSVPAKAPAKAAKGAKKSAATAYTGATKEYVVKNGDTLGSVAYSNGINIRQLKKLNGLTKDTLRVGQKLKIPAEKVVAQKGTAEKRAAAPAKTAAASASATENTAPAVAPAAQAPAAATETAASSDAPAPAATEAAPAAAPAPATATYVVQEGDDMTGVSIRWGVSAAEIRELNNLGENDQLVPGQIIKLPAEAQQ